MSRKTYISGVLVLGAVVLVSLWRSKSDSGNPKEGSADTKIRVAEDEAEPVRKSQAEREGLPLGERDGDLVTGKKSRVGGEEVRDHRDRSPRDLDDTSREVAPAILVAVRRAVRPAMGRCIEKFAVDSSAGANAVVDLTVSIFSEQLLVEAVKLTAKGVSDSAAFQECVQESLGGHRQTVTGAKDVSEYTMTFPYRLQS